MRSQQHAREARLSANEPSSDDERGAPRGPPRRPSLVDAHAMSSTALIGKVSRGSTKPLRFSILGSGTSGALPEVMCVTDPENGCEGCRKTMQPGGEKNVRGNTGGIIRIPQAEGGEFVVLVDCGKTFRQQAIKLFPKLGIRAIDAVILTHLHADAIDGLDDLRPWTALYPNIPVYCHQATYDCISSAFPYLINKSAASGGGFVPHFRWNVFPTDGTPLFLGGIRITPIPVHHGKFFTGNQKHLVCCGFLIDSAILYISDVSYIPQSAWQMIAREVHIPVPPSFVDHIPTDHLPRLQSLIIDCDGLCGGPSHFGFPQAMITAHRLDPVRTYLTDICHKNSHEAWIYLCQEYGKGRRAKEALPNEVNQLTGPPNFPIERAEDFEMFPRKDVLADFDPVAEDWEVFTERALEVTEAYAGGILKERWVRPLVDGMTILWKEEMETGRGLDKARLWDDEYHGV